MEKQKAVYDFLKNTVFLTQVGLSMLTPIGLCILLAGWLQSKFQLGSWVLIIGILLGVGAGISSLYSFIQYTRKESERAKQERERQQREL